MNNTSRGKFLTIMLLVSMIPLGLVLVSTLLILSRVSEETIPTDLTQLLVFGVTFGILQLVGLFGIWKLKKWGVYLFTILTITQTLISFSFPDSTQSNSNPLADIALNVVIYSLLAWAIVQKWKYFK